MASIINGVISGESTGDSFGHAVALNTDGTIVAISAPNNEGDLTSVSSLLGTITNDTNVYYQTNGNSGWSTDSPTSSDYLPAHLKKGINPGSVKVFQNIDGEWTQLGNEIKGENLYDQKGVSLSLSGDGQTLAVGNPLALNSSQTDTKGSVTIYSLENEEWTVAKHIESDNESDRFGHSISLSSDGTVLAVGVMYGVAYAGESADNSGYVNIYQINTNNDGEWGQYMSSITGF